MIPLRRTAARSGVFLELHQILLTCHIPATSPGHSYLCAGEAEQALVVSAAGGGRYRQAAWPPTPKHVAKLCSQLSSNVSVRDLICCCASVS